LGGLEKRGCCGDLIADAGSTKENQVVNGSQLRRGESLGESVGDSKERRATEGNMRNLKGGNNFGVIRSKTGKDKGKKLRWGRPGDGTHPDHDRQEEGEANQRKAKTCSSRSKKGPMKWKGWESSRLAKYEKRLDSVTAEEHRGRVIGYVPADLGNNRLGRKRETNIKKGVPKQSRNNQ